MKATAKIIFNRKHTATDTRPASVVIEVYCNGKRKWLTTGIHCTLREWYNKRGIYISNRNDSDVLNADLARQLNDIQQLIFRAGDAFSLSMIDSETKRSVTFIDFMKRRAEERTDIGEGTRKHHLTLVNMLNDYGKLTEFTDLTTANIRRFDDYLRNKGLMQSTICNQHKMMKAYIHLAQQEHLMKESPYDQFRVSRGSSPTHRYLTYDELMKMAEYPLQTAPLIRARDLFMFQAYTGMAYADVAALDCERDIEHRDSGEFILNNRVKTGEQFYIKLLSPARHILEKYDYHLPVMTLQPYNRFLKEIAGVVGINKTLSSHMGRHTFAVWALNNSIPIEVVSKILGHTNIKTTQIYAKLLQSSVDSAFDHLEHTLNQ